MRVCSRAAIHTATASGSSSSGLSACAAWLRALLLYPRVDETRVGCPLRPNEQAEHELRLLARGTDEKLAVVPRHTAATSGRSSSGTNTSPRQFVFRNSIPSSRTVGELITNSAFRSRVRVPRARMRRRQLPSCC